ncbi:MAG TPA: SNF2-related protein, partial [Actinomycetota bacterium]|nr:SNF2-related protein [Actinomycetota bacterium]
MPRLSPAPSAQPQLRPYQEAGVAWLRDRPRAFLADEAGLGKSRQFVEAARGRTLVVAPGMVLDGGTWDEETERWARDPGAFTQVAYSSLNTRVKTGANASATRPTDELKPEYREPWDSVILDEAHYIKGRKSHWTKAVLNLKAEQVHLGTGTPIPNWADELFIPLQVLHPEKAHPGGELGSYWRWAREWFDCSPTRWSQGMPSVGELLACSPACLDRPPTDPCGHYLEFAEANLGDLFLQRLRDDVLTDLPPLTKVIVETPMTKAQAAAYNALKKDFVAWAGEHGEEIVAWNEAALNEQLIKLSVGLDVI